MAAKTSHPSFDPECGCDRFQVRIEYCGQNIECTIQQHFQQRVSDTVTVRLYPITDINIVFLQARSYSIHRTGSSLPTSSYLRHWKPPLL